MYEGPIFSSHMGESENMAFSYLRLENHTLLLIGVLKTRLLGFYKDARNWETLHIYSIITIICLKDPFI